MNENHASEVIRTARKMMGYYIRTGGLPEKIPDILDVPGGVFIRLFFRSNLIANAGFISLNSDLKEALAMASMKIVKPQNTSMKLSRLFLSTIELGVASKPEKVENKKESIIEMLDTSMHGIAVSGRDDVLSYIIPWWSSEKNTDSLSIVEGLFLSRGLKKDSWKDGKNSIYCFKVETFREHGILRRITDNVKRLLMGESHEGNYI